MDLRTARTKVRRLSQTELSRRSGVSQVTISQLETGATSEPTWTSVYRLAKALRMRPEVVFPVSERSEV